MDEIINHRKANLPIMTRLWAVDVHLIAVAEILRRAS